MTHIIGLNHDVCIFGPLRIWAEDGMVKMEDARDNSYEALSVKEALLRVEGINDMIGNSSDDGEYQDEIDKHTCFVEQMVTVCEKAKEQGMPSDESARKDLKRRQPTSVVVPKIKQSMDM